VIVAVFVGSLATAPALGAAEGAPPDVSTGPVRPQLPEPIGRQADEPGDTGPVRPQLPEPVDAAGAPSQPAAAPVAAPSEPLPTEMPNTGALSVPALLSGLATLVVGIWCVLFSRRGRREPALVEARTTA
jgi:hypothetical protein